MNITTTRRSLRIALVGGVLALAATSATTPARAQPTPSTAEHAKRAQANFDLQNWAAALQEYQAAYAGDPKPEYMWGIAQAQRLSGDCASAIRSYKAYKRNDVTATQSTAAELQITKCEAEIDKKEAEAARRATPAPAPAPSPAPAAEAPPSSAAAQPKDSVSTGPKPFYADVFGDVLFIGGAAASGVGLFFLLKGNSDMKASASDPTYQVYDKAVDDASSKQTIGGVTLAIGGALVAGAIVRWITMDKGSQTTTRTGLSVGPASVGGRF